MTHSNAHSSIEPLEGRTLLSSAVVSNKVLRIRGDVGVNNVEEAIYSAGGTAVSVRVNGVALGTFKTDDLKQVRFFGDSGNDLLETKHVRLPFKLRTYMFGFGGNDTLIGGEGRDVLVGDNGNDLIFGNGGNDSILGGNGSDTIHGGSGQDVIFGGRGDDLIFGDQDGDIIFGELGNDTIFGGGNSDALFGNAGSDSLSGDDGENVLYGGGGGTDTLSGGGRHSTVNSGELKDIKTYMNHLAPTFSRN